MGDVEAFPPRFAATIGTAVVGTVVVVDVREGAELGGGGRPDRELALFAYMLSSVQEFGDCEDACERGLDEDWTG